MIPYIGDFAEDATIYHYFNTFDSNDPSASVTVTTLADTDIYVYKDGSVTDIVTDGASVVIDFDARTGVHKVTIDTSVHADYAIGSDYMVLIEGATVDAGNITAAIFSFSIENRYNAAADDLANATDGLGALKTLIDGVPTTAEFEARTLVAASYFDPAVDTVATVTTLTNLPAITANWLTAAGTHADFGTEVGTAVWATAARTLTASTNFNDIAATDIVSGGAINTTAGAVDSVTLTATCTTNTDMVAAAPTAAAVVNEWETQSQADPTGFHVNVMEVNSDTGVAANLEASLETMVTGTATGGTTSTVTSAVTGHGDDTFIGRVMIFRSGTLQYEAGAITDYDSTAGTFTFAASTWTTSPTTETFVIV